MLVEVAVEPEKIGAAVIIVAIFQLAEDVVGEGPVGRTEAGKAQSLTRLPLLSIICSTLPSVLIETQSVCLLGKRTQI